MNINERAEKAVDLKKNHNYNCCQAVVSVLADQVNLSKEELKQIAAGFCTGMGNMSGTCGALVGAGIIAGLKTEGKQTVNTTKQMSEKFKEKSGAVICKELKVKINDKPVCSCEDCVRNAILIYGDILGV